ncbi:hypothetical protein PAXRUDRAFT_827796 [Paxillus rubicundulus Ve08.2h10]|uniref:WD40 repeat-like protein n=1 Tax=Paxillus rubicundulus Ve08.2h10 TaxID=930991 RepID=A0A0D0DX71_9AGAM|nr:hypothetical protein PAXRUDRAFT_827796 [Paxillus rubicundulus Ve08.2h10]
MDDSSSDLSAPIASPTAASVLGIKGPLRFRRHGASQKAHVVLRRVEVSEDSAYSGGKNSVAYFSLFAQKRIEVKPGKEILLSVASDDGTFTDQAVIFEGDLLSFFDSNSDEEQEVEKQIAQEDSVPDSPTTHVIPPRMRRSWSKHYPQVSSGEDIFVSPPPTHVSVGIQAQPSWSMSSVQAVPPASPLREKLLPLTHEPTEEPPTSDKKTMHVPQPPREPTWPPVDLRTMDDDRSRSLSPMSIGSPPSTPPLSPATERDAALIEVPVTPTKPATGILSDTLSITSSVHQVPLEKQEAPWTHIKDASSRMPQISPVSSETVDMDLQSSPSSKSSASDDDIPGFITGAASRCVRPPSPLVLSAAPVKSGVVAPTPVPLPAPPPPPPSRTIVATPPASTLAIRGTPFNAGPWGEQPLPPSLIATPPAPPSKRPPIRNPFVSGGFVTEFVGQKPSIATKKDPTDHLTPDNLFPPIEPPPLKPEPVVAPLPSSSRAPPTGPQALRVIVPEDRASPISRQSPASIQSQLRHQPDLSSVAPRPPETTVSYPNIPSPTHAKPGYQPITSANDTRLTYTSEGSISNPLNIRPSRFPPPTGPRAGARGASPPHGPRKRVVVGNGWPHNRQTNGHSAATPTTASPPPANAAPAHTRPITPDSTRSSTTPPGLSSIVPYSSPSPPGFLHSSSTFKPVASVDSGIFGLIPQSLSSTPQIKHEMNEWGSPICSRSTQSPIGVTAQNITIQAPRPVAPPSAASTVLRYTPPQQRPPGSGDSTPSVDSKGKKRAFAVEADIEDTRPRKRMLSWPCHRSLFSVHLRSDEDPGIIDIAFSSDGERLAVICNDRTIRIWTMSNRVETARLAQNAPVIAMAWMSDDLGVVSLGRDGVISKWTRSTQNHWQWAKLLDAGKEDSICFAYRRDRIAVAFPRIGVKVWIWIKGTWQPQRSILRQNVTSIKFVEDGEALIGGTSDGVLWYCQVPNGTLRAYAFLKAKVYHLDVNASGTHALVSQVGGRAHLVGIQQTDHKGKIEQVYSTNGDSSSEQRQNFGAVFASGCKTVLFGTVENNLLVWDEAKGEVICGLDHGDFGQVQAISTFDRGSSAYIITGTKRGLLSWWKPPLAE